MPQMVCRWRILRFVCICGALIIATLGGSLVFATSVLLDSDPALQKELENYERVGICFKPFRVVSRNAAGVTHMEVTTTSVIRSSRSLPAQLKIRVSAFDRAKIEENLSKDKGARCYDMVRKIGEEEFQFLGGAEFSELKETPAGYSNSRQTFYPKEKK